MMGFTQQNSHLICITSLIQSKVFLCIWKQTVIMFGHMGSVHFWRGIVLLAIFCPNAPPKKKKKKKILSQAQSKLGHHFLNGNKGYDILLHKDVLQVNKIGQNLHELLPEFKLSNILRRHMCLFTLLYPVPPPPLNPCVWEIVIQSFFAMWMLFILDVHLLYEQLGFSNTIEEAELSLTFYHLFLLQVL